MKCYKKVLVTDNLYPYSLHSMIKVSAEAWHAILYLVTVTPWQYHRGLACYSISYHALAVSTEAWHPYHALAVSQRLGMLSYILSLSRLGSIRRGLACYSISYHALAVSAEAWQAILYLITPWQHPPRLGMTFYILSRLGSIRRGLLFYILSRLGSIRRGLACYSIS